MTFSPPATCSVALNVNTRMSFWNVRWERGSERADFHQWSVLSHDFFGHRPPGLRRCGHGAQMDVKSGVIIPLVPVFLFHSFFPPIFLASSCWTGLVLSRVSTPNRTRRAPIPNNEQTLFQTWHCWIDDTSHPFLALTAKCLDTEVEDPASHNLPASVFAPMPPPRHSGHSHLCVTLRQVAPAFQTR